MKKALIIGNNNYNDDPLNCCVNDATCIAEVLSTNYDGSANFDVNTFTDQNAVDIAYQIEELFKEDDDIALLYYSGHGFLSNHDAGIVGIDGQSISMDFIMERANASKNKNKILIFDSCFSGKAGALSTQIFGYNETVSALVTGVTILAACKEKQYACESGEIKHGVFTALLLDALKGGAANLLGDITPGSIYAYIDRSLGAWEQRPVFKTNVQSFCSVRKANPPIATELLRKIPSFFPRASFELPLDPSYEDTNSPNVKHLLREPYAKQEHVSVFKDLQKLASVGLVVPVDEDHMYYAAMNHKACKLTAMGSFYWKLAKEKRI